MKKVFKIKIVIDSAREKGVVFAEGLDAGVIATQDVVYNDAGGKDELQMVLGALEVGEDLLKSMVKVEVLEVLE